MCIYVEESEKWGCQTNLAKHKQLMHFDEGIQEFLKMFLFIIFNPNS